MGNIFSLFYTFFCFSFYAICTSMFRVTYPNGMKSINDLRTAFEVANKGYAPGRNVKH